MYTRNDPVVDKYCRIAARQLARRCGMPANTREEADARAGSMRAFLSPLKERFQRMSYHVEQGTTLEEQSFSIEKLCFAWADGVRVPANLYLPKRNAPFPAMLLPVGHYADGKATPEYQLLARGLARMGCAALIYDPPGQGERDSKRGDPLSRQLRDLWCVKQHMQTGDLCYLAGSNFAEYFISDSLMALDYLAGRPEIDVSRIGAAGQSGGGTNVQHLCALSDLISLAIPIHCTTTMSALLDVSVGDCEQSFLSFFPCGFDMEDYFLPYLGRQLLILAGEDDFFSAGGARAVYEALLRACTASGAAKDRLSLRVAKGGHSISTEVHGIVCEKVAQCFGLPSAEEVKEEDTLPDFETLAVLSPHERQRNAEQLLAAVAASLHGAPDYGAAWSHGGEGYADSAVWQGNALYVCGRDAGEGMRGALRSGTGTLTVLLDGCGCLNGGGTPALTLEPEGLEAYRYGGPEGYDRDAVYFYLSVLTGAPVACSRLMQAERAILLAMERTSTERVHLRASGWGVFAARALMVKYPQWTADIRAGGIDDVLAARTEPDCRYRRSDIVPGLFAPESSKGEAR